MAGPKSVKNHGTAEGRGSGQNRSRSVMQPKVEGRVAERGSNAFVIREHQQGAGRRTVAKQSGYRSGYRGGREWG